MNKYLWITFLFIAICPPAGIAMLILYLYNDAKKEFFNVKEKKAYDSSKLEDWV